MRENKVKKRARRKRPKKTHKKWVEKEE